jgi:hypothetical protein
MLKAFVGRRYEANQYVSLTAEAMVSARRGRVKEGGFGEGVIFRSHSHSLFYFQLRSSLNWLV